MIVDHGRLQGQGPLRAVVDVFEADGDLGMKIFAGPLGRVGACRLACMPPEQIAEEVFRSLCVAFAGAAVCAAICATRLRARADFLAVLVTGAERVERRSLLGILENLI
ncbi:hypothetical protein [Caballeronia sp. LZ034LL]|uniref:hypothetical protein n=1 Tax=Caballeronia sp. LZ034LL TaxID=3038567 RepID=UPI002854A96D|nr:hypothetical protein [Caballeronia sp. LZ034LL]MDR5835839.1 hypothetical protein [Caballeronia sp. LZ034LL]